MIYLYLAWGSVILVTGLLIIPKVHNARIGSVDARRFIYQLAGSGAWIVCLLSLVIGVLEVARSERGWLVGILMFVFAAAAFVLQDRLHRRLVKLELPSQQTALG